MRQCKVLACNIWKLLYISNVCDDGVPATSSFNIDTYWLGVLRVKPRLTQHGRKSESFRGAGVEAVFEFDGSVRVASHQFREEDCRQEASCSGG